MDVDNALHLGFAVPGRILSIGVTGHREGNPAFAAHRIGIERTLATLLAAIKSRIASGAAPARARLVTNLANGCDLMAARAAVALDLDLITPLPFGDHVNRALNMLNMDWATAHTIAQGNAPADLGERANWQALGEAFKNAIAFELCDQDAALQECLLRLSTDGTNRKLMLEFESLVGTRTKAASRMTVEQSDILLAIWDGKSPSVAGGTRDTMAEALAADVPVIWLDASQPDCLHWLDDPGDLVIAPDRDAPVDLAAMTDLICANMDADWQELDQAKAQLSAASWRPRSRLRFHAYRRIETLFGDEGARFGSVRQSYQTPEAAAQAGEGTMLGTITALLQPDPNTATSLATKVVSRFAAADGISTYLSDAYRGGMAANFLLSAAAIIAGIAYLPLVGPDGKWPFALAELLLLLAIVALTVAGVRGQWHKRIDRFDPRADHIHCPAGKGEPRDIFVSAHLLSRSINRRVAPPVKNRRIRDCRSKREAQFIEGHISRVHSGSACRSLQFGAIGLLRPRCFACFICFFELAQQQRVPRLQCSIIARRSARIVILVGLCPLLQQ